jgi:N utilization substance protein B
VSRVEGQGGSRRRARECALQVLYSLDLNGTIGAEQALAVFWAQLAAEAGEPAEADVIRFAEHLVRGTWSDLAAIDERVQRASRNWRLERMARVDRNLLRLGCFELSRGGEVPARVVINEAIELAKRFGTAESPAFVNGVLDRIASEFGGAPGPGE